MHPSFFFSSSSYQYTHIYTSIWSMCMCLDGFFFSPMIAREGHKISRTYTLYLYYGAPLRGDDKMSNRSSGTNVCIRWWSIQYGSKRESERRKKKKQETNCEKTRVYVYLDLSNKRNVLIGWTEKKHKREREKFR
jgi:hypothetical protein